MKLSYNSHYKEFVLLTGMPPEDPEWQQKVKNIYITKSIKAAANFREHSDDSAKEYFKNLKPKLYDVLPFSLPSFLKPDPHQLKGINWILGRQHSYLAHAPGAGKTFQSIVANELSRKPRSQCLIICPPDLVSNWEREIHKFSFEYRTVGIVGTTSRAQFVDWDAEYLIVPYSMIHKDWVMGTLWANNIHMLICDEASALKAVDTQRSKAVYHSFLKSGYSYPRHVVFLDGSPAPNRYMEYWMPTYNLCPEAIEYMDQTEFGFKFCGATRNDYGWEFKHSSNGTELKERLTKHFFHIVPEDQLGHAERIRSIIYLSKDLLTKETKKWEEMNLNVKLDLLTDETTQGSIARWRAEVGKDKISTIIRRAQDRIDAGDQVLIFGWHRDVCLRIHEGLRRRKVGLIIGGVQAATREQTIKDFNEGKLKGIVGNILALSRGHNIQNADRVLFAEYSWSDEVNKQAEKRVSRKGRTKGAVPCEYYVVRDSLDEMVLQSVQRKAIANKKVMG